MANKILLLILIFFGFGLNSKIYSEEDHTAHQAGVREFSIVAIEYRGTKVWVPGTLIVRKGDKVKIKLINNINSDPNTHGFAIDEFGIKKVVARGEIETVEFSADKEGLFTIYCQLHPAHIGGQLLVLKE
ncbi:MAG: cupredoxin domain-containing protein [Elusimicrobia bacterium]|nr:cupredoxin domain-containing protein [Elusimicrobiota bacterium]